MCREVARPGPRMTTAWCTILGWQANRRLATPSRTSEGFETCAIADGVTKGGQIDHFKSDVTLLADHGVGIVAAADSIPADLPRLARDLIAKLAASGALAPRVLRIERTPALDRAFQRLLAVYNAWDAQRYEPLVRDHLDATRLEAAHAELAGYHALHGTCSGGHIDTFTSSTEAVYALDCERGRFRLSMMIDAKTGKFVFFNGISSGVRAIPGTRDAASRALALVARRDDKAYHRIFEASFMSPDDFEHAVAPLRERHGKCTLGDAVERDGAGVQRFHLDCARGGDQQMVIRLAKNGRIDALYLRPDHAGPCATP